VEKNQELLNYKGGMGRRTLRKSKASDFDQLRLLQENMKSRQYGNNADVSYTCGGRRRLATLTNINNDGRR